MIYISHKGNINGRIIERENSPSYIIEALRQGYNVEVDVWDCGNDGLLLGHDTPDYPINKSFLMDYNLWCHAKNIYTLQTLLQLGSIHCFFHNEDDCTLTSKGYIWTYPKKQIENTICLMPELNNLKKEDIQYCSGICSDFISMFK